MASTLGELPNLSEVDAHLKALECDIGDGSSSDRARSDTEAVEDGAATSEILTGPRPNGDVRGSESRSSSRRSQMRARGVETASEAPANSRKPCEPGNANLLSELSQQIRVARTEQRVAEEQCDELVDELAAMKAAREERMQADSRKEEELATSTRSLHVAEERNARSIRLVADMRKELMSLADSCARDRDQLQTLRGVVGRDDTEHSVLTCHLQSFERMLEAAHERMQEPVSNLSRMLEEFDDSQADVDTKSEGNGLRRELRLLQEIEEIRRAFALYEEEMAGEKALFESKFARLQDLLKRSHESTAEGSGSDADFRQAASVSAKRQAFPADSAVELRPGCLADSE